MPLERSVSLFDFRRMAARCVEKRRERDWGMGWDEGGGVEENEVAVMLTGKIKDSGVRE